jgi:hypothetical protein
MGIERFEDIIAWQKAKELTIQIYRLFEKVKILVLKTRYSELQFL